MKQILDIMMSPAALGTRVSLMYVQLHYNYKDNYYMGKINNFIMWNGSLLKGGEMYMSF